MIELGVYVKELYGPISDPTEIALGKKKKHDFKSKCGLGKSFEALKLLFSLKNSRLIPTLPN